MSRSMQDTYQASLRVPLGIDGYWTIIRTLDRDGPWTAMQVANRTNTDRKTVFSYIRRLLLGGYVEQVGEVERPRQHFNSRLYRLRKSPEEAPLLNADGSEKPEPVLDVLWRTMKMVKEFSARELMDLASDDDRQITMIHVRKYVALLADRGVLIRTDRRHGRAGGRYRLARNLGQKAPRLMVGQLLWDPNAKQVVGPIVAGEGRS